MALVVNETTTELDCDRDKVFETFPLNFLIIFFILGFGSSVISCLFVHNTTYIKFIPQIIVIIFETVLALFVGLMKVNHTEELLFELYDTLNCHKRKNHELETVLGIFDGFNIKSMDVVQTQFNCCGVNSYEDWIETSGVIPYSCCINLEYCSLMGLKDKIGCFSAMKRDVYSNWNAMIMFIIIFVFIKLIILAMHICNAITYKTEQEEREKVESTTQAADEK